jgi:HSP20 family protein
MATASNDNHSPKLRYLEKRWLQVHCPSYQREVTKLFDSMIHRAWGRSDWLPAMDIVEAESKLIVRLDLPGMTLEQVTVCATESRLEIAGNREGAESSDQARGGHATVHERPSGNFSRVIEFDQPVDHENLEVEMKDGVLIVTLPRKAEEEKEHDGSK